MTNKAMADTPTRPQSNPTWRGKPGPNHERRSLARRTTLRQALVRAMGIGIFYVVVLVFFTSQIPNFLNGDNITGILSASSALGIVAIGQTYAIVSGGFDLSVGGVVPLAAVIYAKTSESGSVPFAMGAALLSGCAVGVLNATVIAKMKINPLITTLGTLSVVGGLAYVVTDGLTIPLAASGASLWGDTAFWGIQYGVIGFVALAVVATLVLKFTTYGRALYAVGGNAEAAELAGLRVKVISGSVYVVCGACAAFAGIIMASQLLSAAPNVGVDTTLNSVAAVILGGAALAGGIGGVPGTVLGVLLLGTMANGLALLQVSSFYQTIATGGILLLAVAFARLRDVLMLGAIFRTTPNPEPETTGQNNP
ncbi:ABC transporter permease [Arthrobacter bambusae]|uniref:ABC transporter permease n=1 Tax=Arthrobacter bambusae TaxID=1338426 RepID=UPI002780B12C|nr:ABC transporter permease [Arthrobacter bambusae]MDQ0212992.1 ribose transport system permease protein [Arthrobacter bambusae]MDQ0237298.1 ribose transport system permease protein [Arthrobacter bambusae]